MIAAGTLAAISFVLSIPSVYAQDAPYFRAPAGKEFARVVPGGTTILPNGRFLTPKGERLYTGDDLWNVAVSQNGKLAAGFSDGAVIIYALPAKTGSVPRALPTKGLAPAGIFTKDGSRLILSDGDDGGGIRIYDTSGWDAPATASEGRRFQLLDQKPIRIITANDAKYKASYINDIALSPDEKYAFGVDVAHQRLVVFDLEAGTVVGSDKAGRQPYALTLSEDGKRVYVANIGIFDYALVPAPKEGEGEARGLTKPPFGFPSKEAEKGVYMEGRQVPGLGSAYVPDSQSVWMYDVALPTAPKVLAKAKSGILIHAPADGGKSVGGSAPNKLLLRANRLYVSNANNDTVQVFDARTLKSLKTIKLTPLPQLARLRGVIPSGMALNRTGDKLYVCESGLNSIAVIDTTTYTVLGHIPTGWFPMQVTLSPDERTLFIATQKGIGRGPRGALNRRPATDERFSLPEMPGMINAVPVPTPSELAAWSQEVLTNNGLVDKRTETAAMPKSPFPLFPGKASEQIQYVVFITKENHTFDGIFGGLKGAKAEPDYAEFGMQGWIREKGKEERMPIMPNHIRLAERFAISDNFYMEPQASGDGHRWLNGIYPSLWTTRVFYAGWNYLRSSEAPGRLISFGSDGSPIPEDYLENGSLWEHLHRNGIPFRNYGEGYELPQTDEGRMTNKSGTFYQVNYPMPKVLFDNTCFDFPAYNNYIPDIARADWFKEDLAKYRKSHGGKIPRFINIAICNDHGASPRPKDGYPYVCSFMADNDLALGMIVEHLSNQPEWKNMAIFVTQDDSGGDDDHIDRHRSFVLAISPYAKKGYVSRDHTSIMSIIKSIYLLFGIGPNNLFDALATDLSDMFTNTPDFTPYKAVMTDPRVFKPEETFDPSDPKFERRRQMKPEVAMDDPKFVEWLRNRATIGEKDEKNETKK